jgi:hypothetical protein
MSAPAFVACGGGAYAAPRGEHEEEGEILLMVLLDAALHLVYELPYRCHYAHGRLARLGSSRSWWTVPRLHRPAGLNAR